MHAGTKVKVTTKVKDSAKILLKLAFVKETIAWNVLGINVSLNFTTKIKLMIDVHLFMIKMVNVLNLGCVVSRSSYWSYTE